MSSQTFWWAFTIDIRWQEDGDDDDDWGDPSVRGIKTNGLHSQ